jgi:hypothetical protein
MAQYIAVALGWIASNAIAIVAGGYLQYRFGHYVEPVLARVLSAFRKP